MSYRTLTLSSLGRPWQTPQHGNPGYVPVSTNRFLWDGQVLAAEVSSSGSIIRSYMRGTDLSETTQGAGGVGGLLEVSYHGTATTNCFVAYDGNGNIAALVNAADGTVAANYEYDPFGQTIRRTGPMASANPMRFSTQYADDNTREIKYLYRVYSASTGKWVSRDPLNEYAGLNLYCFLDNDAIDKLDLLGEKWTIVRNHDRRATAKSSDKADTWDDLARLTLLDIRDYRDWVKPRPDPGQRPDCKTYTIPNTVYIDIGKQDLVDKSVSAIFSYFRAEASYNQSYFENEGYDAVLQNEVGQLDIENHLGSWDVYMYYFYGHGDSAKTGDINTGGNHLEWVEPGRYTIYGIRRMALSACYSLVSVSKTTASGNFNVTPWERNVSTLGLVIGYAMEIDGFDVVLPLTNPGVVKHTVYLKGTDN